jgi:hypothetical protein
LATKTTNKVLENRGCYTNIGNQMHVTNRLNSTNAVTVVKRTGDSKLGEMTATHAPQSTCPTTCKFYPKLSKDIRGQKRMDLAATLATIEAEKIDELKPDIHARIHVVGDCQTSETASIVGSAMVRYGNRSKNGSIAYTYTHSWQTVPLESWQGANVLASCETTAEVEQANQLGYQAELTLVKHKSRKLYKIDGKTILPCPNNWNKQVKCSDCMKCADLKLLKAKNWTIGLSIIGATRIARKRLEG